MRYTLETKIGINGAEFEKLMAAIIADRLGYSTVWDNLDGYLKIIYFQHLESINQYLLLAHKV